MDVVKERLQIQRSVPAAAAAESLAGASTAAPAAAGGGGGHGNTRFTGSWNAATTILRQEGVRGWYRGYFAHQCVWGPFNAVYFTAYEFLKERWTDWLNKQSAAKKTAALHLHSAGDVSSFGSDGSPLPVLHDRIEVVSLPNYAFPVCGALSGCLAAAATAPLDLVKTRLQTQGNSGQYKGAFDCARKIVQQEGAASMMRGLGARCLWLSPNIALTMTTYELIKAHFLNNDA
jgi:solute carrier family 25 S-adenosylmethionine transporter 26